ncbi:hypothetical protein FSARC_1819 [Fusarium sarcochroum]|uniref:Uncharacterized protein n=1 Tax=Fusarium sarcochroum TaxID=1208366 RepID=A0A8H4XED6_9HYPO|nr:hypothetical protein FSARC_1819 [Fusarium sarcochroum]
MSSSNSNRGRSSTSRGRGNTDSTGTTGNNGESSASASSSSQNVPNPSSLVVMGPPTHIGGRPSTVHVSTIRGNVGNNGSTPDWRANAFFQDNVRRVLGPEHVGRWPDMMTMMNMTRVHVGENGVNNLDRAWNEREVEASARLRAWGVSDLVIAGLLGNPTVAVGPELLAQFGSWALDEHNRLEEVHGLGGFGES